MVLVTVGKNYTPDFVLIFHKVGYVRDNQVETGCFVCGEYRARVNYYNIVAALDCGHIFTYFAYAAEKNYSYWLYFVFRVPAFAFFRRLYNFFAFYLHVLHGFFR